MTTNTNPALATRGSATGFSFEANGSADNNRSAHATQANRRHAEPTAPAGGTEPTRDREWWRREAGRVGSDWANVIALRAAAVMLWRVHHDPHRADMPMTACPTCGASRCINPSFCHACQRVDEEARQHRDTKKQSLRRLLKSSVSLERAYTELNRTPGRAAASTIEALMFALRCGGEALTDPNNQRRLSELSETQLHEVCVRLQKFKPEIARPWTAHEIEMLVGLWSDFHHG
jgi:hypothetical protein